MSKRRPAATDQQTRRVIGRKPGPSRAEEEQSWADRSGPVTVTQMEFSEVTDMERIAGDPGYTRWLEDQRPSLGEIKKNDLESCPEVESREEGENAPPTPPGSSRASGG